MNPGGPYDDPATEALLAEYEYEIKFHPALLAETGMDLDGKLLSEPPGLPADYRVGNT